MSRRLLFSMILATSLPSVLPATAAPAADTTPADKSLVMSKIDTDNDGTISLEEARKAASTKFDALDTDKEGTLDATELTGILSHSTLGKADPDKDGTLDKPEFLAVVAKQFAVADHDKDGTLDAKELSTEAGRSLVSLLAY